MHELLNFKEYDKYIVVLLPIGYYNTKSVKPNEFPAEQ